MGKIRIITDTASDMTTVQAEELGVIRVPLSIRFGDDEMPMDTEEDFSEFFQRMEEEKELPTTGQPSPELYIEEYEKAKEAQEDVLVLALSGGLSGTVNAARLAKDICGYENVWVVDTRQAIITQRMLVEHAVSLRKKGMSAAEIAADIESVKDRLVVCGVLDTLTNLRKGGRISANL